MGKANESAVGVRASALFCASLKRNESPGDSMVKLSDNFEAALQAPRSLARMPAQFS